MKIVSFNIYTFTCIFLYSAVITINIILLFCSNKLEMTYCANNENSLNTKNLTLVTAVDNNYAVHSASNKAVTDLPNHTPTYDVSSLYSKWLSECRIISRSLLELQETIGQGIVNICI